jgi:hypothetical protein
MEPSIGIDVTPIIVIVVALFAIGLVWKVITGVIRLIITVGVIAVAAYFLWNYLG